MRRHVDYAKAFTYYQATFQPQTIARHVHRLVDALQKRRLFLLTGERA